MIIFRHCTFEMFLLDIKTCKMCIHVYHDHLIGYFVCILDTKVWIYLRSQLVELTQYVMFRSVLQTKPNH